MLKIRWVKWISQKCERILTVKSAPLQSLLTSALDLIFVRFVSSRDAKMREKRPWACAHTCNTGDTHKIHFHRVDVLSIHRKPRVSTLVLARFDSSSLISISCMRLKVNLSRDM